MLHRISWIAGGVLVGDGTLGNANGVYFLDVAGTKVAQAGVDGDNNPLASLIPICGPDGTYGASYVKAIFQLYRRVRYRAIRVSFVPLQSSTANNMTLSAAPIRGPPEYEEVVSLSTGANDTQTQASVMSMSGSQTRDSFEQLDLDLTPYIAGGSGPKQNEFSNGGEDGKIADDSAGAIGRVPACFVVSGNSTLAALQGTVTHYVVVETIVDLYDFTGAMTMRYTA
jgi:hypothetical protein